MKRKKKGLLGKILIGVAVLMVFSVVFGGKDKDVEPSVRETPQLQSEQSAPVTAARGDTFKQQPVATQKSETTTKAEEPANAENTAKAEEPTKTEEPAKTEAPVKAEEQAKTETPAKPEESAKIEEPAKTEEPAKEEPAKEEPKPEPKTDPISAELKAFLTSYEAFMDEYCAFMESYDMSDMTMLQKYADMMNKYADFSAKCDAWNGKMNDAETAYYLEVLNRVNQKLLKVVQN